MCLCVHIKAWRLNKAEIDAVLGRESFLMVVDIQLQKILHWGVEKVKPRNEQLGAEKEKRKESKWEVKKKKDFIKQKLKSLIIVPDTARH